MDPYLGEIRMFAGNFAPQGWAFCDGTPIPVQKNTALFSLITTTYGGDGVNNFNLPDLRGAVPMHVGGGGAPYGFSTTLGGATGSANVTLNVNQMPAHSHQVNASSNSADQPTPGGFTLASSVDPIDGTVISTYTDATADSQLNANTIAPSGGNQPFSVVQPSLGINYIIALEGIFPSRP